MFSGNGPAVRKNVELARRVLSMRLIETVHAEPRDSVDQPSYRVNFWQWSGEAFLNDNMREVLVTLEGKRMCVESIFTECIDGVDYLYWYTVQGQAVTPSRIPSTGSTKSTLNTGKPASTRPTPPSTC